MTKERRINWFGTFSSGQGYSGSSEQFAVALNKHVDVSVVQFKQTHAVNISAEGKHLLRKPFKLADVGLCYGFPASFDSMMNNKFRVGYTMFETDKLPVGGSEWVGNHNSAADAVNKTCDLLLVPCEHNRQLFRSSGVKIPIEVVNIGVHPTAYKPFQRPKRSVFTFLMMGTLTIRKNPGNVISAFINKFKDVKDARLVIKTQSGTFGHMEFNDCGNIEIIDDNYTMEQMTKLVQDADCFVFPSRGEGFGMPPIEASATGIPSIIAANTGMLEYANPKYFYVVKSAGKSKAIRFPKNWGDVGNWYESDFDDLQNKMWEVYSNQAEARRKGMLASMWVTTQFNYDRIVREQMIKAIEKHYDGWSV